MKKILIITYSFPPLNNIASRRFGELVPYLKKFGWEPTILTTNSNGTLPVGVSEKNIIRIGNHIQKSTKVDKSGLNSASLMKIKRSLGFNSRLLDRTYLSWFHANKKNIKDYEKFNVILTTFGPGSALFLGRYLSRKSRTPLIVDFRDLGSLYDDNYFKQNKLSKIIDKILEKNILKNTVGITSVSETLVDILSKEYNKPSLCIYNGWNNNFKKYNLTNEVSKNYIYYAGRLYPHQMKSIYMLMNVLSNFKKTNFLIRSLGPSKLNLKIEEYANEIGISKQVKLLDPADQDVVLKESQCSLANLVVEDLDQSKEWKKGTLTGKFLGLLPLRPPILTIARRDSEIGDILLKTNKGVLCSKEEEIISFLEANKSNYYGNNKIYSFSKEAQARNLCEYLDALGL